MKAKVLILTIIAITLSCLFAGCAGQPAEPTPAPTPPSPPRTLPRFPAEFIEMNATTAKSYLPGEEVVIEFSFKNITDEPFEIDPFPPDIEIIGRFRHQDELVCLFPAGTETKSLEPQEVISHTVMWDQRDDQGQPVDCGAYWFRIMGGGTLVDAASFVVFILPPEGVMEKTIEVNESQTVNSVTFILEQVRLSAYGAMFIAFNADYKLDEDPETPPPPLKEILAEYSFGGGTREADSACAIGGGSELEGAEYVWKFSVPVPNGTKELTFTITKFGDQEGPWEFHIPLQ